MAHLAVNGLVAHMLEIRRKLGMIDPGDLGGSLQALSNLGAPSHLPGLVLERTGIPWEMGAPVHGNWDRSRQQGAGGNVMSSGNDGACILDGAWYWTSSHEHP
jgi:hypothetical protein